MVFLPSLNICVIGDDSENICKKIAKKGSEDEIAFYNTSYLGKRITVVTPIAYPAKISPLIYCINISDIAVLSINKLDNVLGEEIIALDMLKKEKGVIISKLDVGPLIKNTVVENFRNFSDINEAKDNILNYKISRDEGEKGVFGIIDHAFEVKGVGTVVLGFLKSGKVAVHDKLQLAPLRKEILVRSIQLQSKNVDEIKAGERFGFAIKGISSKQIKRGAIVTSHLDKLVITNEYSGKLVKSKYVNDSEDKTLHAIVGMQKVTCELKDNKISFEKKVALRPGDIITIVKPNAQPSRIVGKIIVS